MLNAVDVVAENAIRPTGVGVLVDGGDVDAVHVDGGYVDAVHVPTTAHINTLQKKLKKPHPWQPSPYNELPKVKTSEMNHSKKKYYGNSVCPIFLKNNSRSVSQVRSCAAELEQNFALVAI